MFATVAIIQLSELLENYNLRSIWAISAAIIQLSELLENYNSAYGLTI